MNLRYIKNLFFILLITAQLGMAQTDSNIEQSRIQSIKNHLELLAIDNAGLNEQVKTEIHVSSISLSNFLIAISEIHKINLNLAPDLNQITIINNFSNVTVTDLLVFLCKEYRLTIEFTGNILSIKKYVPPIETPEKHFIPVTYNPDTETISINANKDSLYEVFKRIIDESGKNLVFAPGMENKLLTSYIKQIPFDTAMDQLALANNMTVGKTREQFYVFEENLPLDPVKGTPLKNRIKSNDFKVLDYKDGLLEVDFVNAPIARVIDDISTVLDLNVFTATPLDKAGNVTFKIKEISFDNLLDKMFELKSQTNTVHSGDNNQNLNRNLSSQNGTVNHLESAFSSFTFKKEGNTYFFGTEDQLSVRSVAIVHLEHRSVELLADPAGGRTSIRTVGRTYGNRNNNHGYNSYNTNSGYDSGTGLNRTNRESVNTLNRSSFSDSGTKAEALLSVLPDEIKQDLDIKIDFELNSFYVLGPSAKIERLKKFIKEIDKPVPVILIEVMLIEVSRSTTVETGISWGIGDEPVETKGGIFPKTDLVLGAKTINKVLNGFDGFGHVNLGKVVPNFFATIKAMEENGNIKIRSTPKLSTLNGHRATFSNGQTSYYAVTQRNIYGTDNPQTSEITNYEPIDAELGLTIKPLVSGDGQVTLDIFVIQSDFGARIAEDAPPDLTSREFSSIIRVQDQDIVVLGGLEEQLKDDRGSGVPFLARIPVIKWLFSHRKREDSRSKLTVLIKPTVIY